MTENQIKPGATGFAEHFNTKQSRLLLLVIALEGSKELKHLLLQEVRCLNTHSRLAGLSGITPLLYHMQELLVHLPMESEVDMHLLSCILTELVNAITHLTNPEKSKSKISIDLPLGESQIDDPYTALCTLAIDLIEQYKELPDFGMEDNEFVLKAVVAEQYTSEGSAILDQINRLVLSPQLTSEPDAVCTTICAQITALLGNTEVLLSTIVNEPSQDHPLTTFREGLYDLTNLITSLQTPDISIEGDLTNALSQSVCALDLLLEDISENRISLQGKGELYTSLEKLEELITRQLMPDDEFIDETNGSKQDFETETDGTELDKQNGLVQGNDLSADQSNHQSDKEKYVQVRQDRIEMLTRLCGELLVARGTLTHTQTLMNNVNDVTQVADSLARSERAFTQTISELEDTVHEIRMRRINDLFQRFPRLIRDLAKEQNKSINLIIHGEETEVDNGILQCIDDPMLHLVRNACDHGLESEADRIAAGKPPGGTLTLAGYLLGSEVAIEIKDDGRGIDPDHIRTKAVAKGFLTEREANELSDQEAQNLIFQPAFSTAERVTEVSGRGVGMDIVKHNLEQVNGTITIDSVKGQYTSFRLVLPVVMSATRGLLVETAGKRYLVPLETVNNMLSISPGQIHTYLNSQLVKLRDTTVPFKTLSSILHPGHQEGDSDNPQIAAILLQVDTHNAVIAVDKILGIEDIAIRPLPWQLEQLDLYLGCSIMTDGKVVPVLNSRRLFPVADQKSSPSVEINSGTKTTCGVES